MLKDFSAAFRVLGTALDDWWSDWVSLTALSLAWLLCVATVILAAPATLVLYRVARQSSNGESFTVSQLLGFLKGSFWKGWHWLIVNLLLAAGLALNFSFYGQLRNPAGTWLLLFNLFLGVFWLATQFYVLPYLLLQERPGLWKAFKNAVLTILASPAYNLIVLGSAAALLYAGIRLPLLLFLGLPALLAQLGMRAVQERLRTFGVPPGGSGSPD
jgi:uncharacterized membrane protein YesL